MLSKPQHNQEQQTENRFKCDIGRVLVSGIGKCIWILVLLALISTAQATIYVTNNLTIQDAIDSISANRSWKETIVVIGKQTTGYSINVPDNIILDLKNADITWIGEIGSGTKIFNVYGNNIEIYGGNSKSNGADYHFLLSGNNIKLFGGNYSGFVGTSGLFKITGSDIEISGITAYNNDKAIGINNLNGATNVNIHNNLFYNFSDMAVDSGSSDSTSQLSNIKVNYNTIIGGEGGGIGFYSNVINSEAIGNTIQNKGSRCFRISNQNNNGNPTNIQISNNQCFDFKYAAVWLQGSESVKVINNQFISSVQPKETAILLDTNINKNTTIYGNSIKMQQHTNFLTIRASVGSTYGFIVLNNIFDGGAGSYFSNADNSDISNNIFKNANGYGIEVGNTKNSVFINNRIYNSKDVAIKEYLGSSNNIYYGNIFKDNGGCIISSATSVKYFNSCDGVIS